MNIHTPPKPLHGYACPLSLKLAQFCCSGKHCFGKYPPCYPYLLQVINPSFSQSMAWLCLLAQPPPRSEPSFQVILVTLVGNENYGMTPAWSKTTVSTTAFKIYPYFRDFFNVPKIVCLRINKKYLLTLQKYIFT